MKQLTPHDRQSRRAVAVERLDRDRGVGRHAEHRRAVLLNRNSSQDTLRLPRAIGTHTATGAIFAFVLAGMIFATITLATLVMLAGRTGAAPFIYTIF